MSPFTNVAALLALSMMQSQVARATQPDDVTQLMAIDKRMQRAFIDRDWTALDEILTDDYVLVSSSGNELTKQDVLRNAAAPGTRWEINETSDWKVRVRGDTAIWSPPCIRRASTKASPSTALSSSPTRIFAIRAGGATCMRTPAN